MRRYPVARRRVFAPLRAAILGLEFWQVGASGLFSLLRAPTSERQFP